MFLVTSLRIILRASQKWIENGGARLGAALAYYTIFSTAPLMLIAIHTSGAIFGEDAARGNVQKRLEQITGKTVAVFFEKLVENAAQPTETAWTPTVSVILLIVAALGAFLHMRTSLCMIWRLEPPHDNTWLAMLWDYTLAVIMVFVGATLIIVSLAASLVMPYLLKAMQEAEVPEEISLQWLELATSFLFLALLFAAVYRILSGGRISWGYVVYGSLVASLLFTVGKLVLGYYIVYSGLESMYGAAGSIVVFMMWVYYSSQILFFGAEMIQARRTRHDWLNDPEKKN